MRFSQLLPRAKVFVTLSRPPFHKVLANAVFSDLPRTAEIGELQVRLMICYIFVTSVDDKRGYHFVILFAEVRPTNLWFPSVD
jgi:hypothetical protein